MMFTKERLIQLARDVGLKGLSNGVLNALGSFIMFSGADIINFRIPLFGTYAVPDSFILFLSGYLGSAVSDIMFEMVHDMTPDMKIKDTYSFITDAAAYNLSQLPIILWGGMPNENIPQYLLMSSSIHYTNERIYHDIVMPTERQWLV